VKLRSFRIRIALVLVLLTGSALVGFGAMSGWLLYNAKMSRLDEVMKIQLFRAARAQQRDRWLAYEALLPRIFGVEAETPTAFLIQDATGAVVYQSRQWPADLDLAPLWPPPPNPSKAASPAPTTSTTSRPLSRSKLRFSDPRLVTRQTTADTWRVGAATLSRSRVAIAISLKAVDSEMAAIRSTFLLSIITILLIIAGAAWILSGRALRPIRQLTQAIRQVTVKGLDQRVPVGDADQEFAALIQVFNQMLENLDRSFHHASRFSADAAHELKTPLAILQGELEQAIHKADRGSELQQHLSSLLDEVRRLSGIVRKLLLLSLADAGRMNLHLIRVNVSELLVQMLEDIELLDPSLTVEAQIAPAQWVLGDRDLLAQALHNLIRNAVKYNLPKGWIKISVFHSQAKVLITVTNASNAILPDDRDRIFDRFHRGDPARTRHIEGTGLGLSLAREIVRAHHGDIALMPTPPGQVSLKLSLPAQT
jgi:two-component system, OmpR family, heavy metal sensor histidine kinase CusS